MIFLMFSRVSTSKGYNPKATEPSTASNGQSGYTYVHRDSAKSRSFDSHRGLCHKLPALLNDTSRLGLFSICAISGIITNAVTVADHRLVKRNLGGN
jgi:hypothetical protein